MHAGELPTNQVLKRTTGYSNTHVCRLARNMCVVTRHKKMRPMQSSKGVYQLLIHTTGFHEEQWGQGYNCDGDAGQSCGMGLWGQYAVRQRM